MKRTAVIHLLAAIAIWALALGLVVWNGSLM